MKYKKIGVIVLFLFSILTFLNLYNLKLQRFESVERKFSEEYNEVEKRLIIEGKSKLDLEAFKNVFKDDIMINFYNFSDIKKNEEELSYKSQDESKSFKMDIFIEEEINFRAIYTTKHNKENLEEVKKNINHLLEKVSYNLRYFKELKGRIYVQDDLDKVLDKELKAVGIKRYSFLKINNGYTGKAELTNSNINFAICTYEKDSYVVIGEPLIVSTY